MWCENGSCEDGCENSCANSCEATAVVHALQALVVCAQMCLGLKSRAACEHNLHGFRVQHAPAQLSDWRPQLSEAQQTWALFVAYMFSLEQIT